MFRRLMQLAGLALAPFAVLLASRVFGMLAAAPIAFAYFLRQQRRQKLSYHAQQMFTSFLGQQDRKVFRRMAGLRRRVSEHFATRWGLVTLPSCVVLFQLLSALLLAPIGLKMAWDAERWSGFLSDLWQVHASVIGITFVVMVLLVEMAAAKLGHEHLLRLYVRETDIQPIAYAGLTLAATIGLVRLVIAHFDSQPWWVGGLGLSCAFKFGLFLVAIARLYRDTLRFSLPSEILRARLRDTAEAVARVVRSVIVVRLGNALLAQVCDKLELPLSSFARFRQGLAPIQAARHGRVIDIRLDKLERFAQMLERKVQVAGQPDHPVRGFLVADLDSSLAPETAILARVHRDVATAKAMRLLQSAYEIAPADAGEEQSLRAELRFLKSEASASLRERQPDAFERVLDHYESLFELTLGIFKSYNLSMSQIASSVGLTRISLPLMIMERDLHHIVRAAVSTQDLELMRPAMHFPMRLARLAQSVDDLDLFSRFTRLLPAAYGLVSHGEPNRARAFVVDASWTHLKDLTEWFLIRRLESDLISLEELARLSRYLSATAAVFNDLLKAAVDATDQASFASFCRALDRLLRHHRPDQAVPDHFHLEYALQNGSLSKSDREASQQRLTWYRALQESRALAEKTIHLIYFGIGSWLAREYAGLRLERGAFAAMFERTRSHFSDLGELSSTYLGTFEEGRLMWGWETWVLSQLPEGDAHFIDTKTWMELFYCLQGLRLTPEDITEQGTPIAPDRQIQHIIGNLEKACGQLGQERDLWRGIVTDQDLARVESFLELHRRAMAIQERSREEWIIEQPISPSRWQEFQERFRESWERTAVIRDLVKRLGQIDDRTREPPPRDMKAFGMNTRYPKKAFVDDPYVHSSGLGSASGGNLGNGENQEVLSTISEKLGFADRVQLDRLAPGIVSGIDMMVEKGYAPQIVVMDGRLRYHEQLFNSEDFLRAWSQECEPLNWPGFEHRMEGRIRGVPVFAIDGMPSDNVLVLDLKRLGRWIQYQVESAPGETLWFCLDEIDHEKAAEWINQFPHLIDTEKGETRDKAIWRLQQQVHLRVLERFEYLVEDALAGIRIQIIGEE